MWSPEDWDYADTKDLAKLATLLLERGSGAPPLEDEPIFWEQAAKEVNCDGAEELAEAVVYELGKARESMVQCTCNLHCGDLTASESSMLRPRIPPSPPLRAKQLRIHPPPRAAPPRQGSC